LATPVTGAIASPTGKSRIGLIEVLVATIRSLHWLSGGPSAGLFNH
jgi:hypothetical protein